MIDDETQKLKEVADDAGHAYGQWFKRYMNIFTRRFMEWLLVFMFGYYNLSFGWLMAPLFFLVLRDKRAKEKKVKFDIIRSIANAEEKDILLEIQRFSNLPSWVTFPDMERVEWLNKIVRQLWPYAGHYVYDLCKYSIESSIRTALEEYKLSGFRFEKIILGDTPFRLSGVKVYDDTSRHEIIMDMDFAYAGDCKFEVSVSKFKMGIKDLQISGRMRVVMKPLVRQIPLVGGLQVFFLNNPDVDFNLIGLADVFDMPGLSDILRSIVIEQIAHMMVLPNRYPIQLVEDINIVELKHPAPAGVLRIHVIEAKNLMKKDVGLMGMGKSDPYCILRLGAQKFQTKTINNTVNPKWDYSCEALANVIRRQRVTIECWDYDYSPLKSYENDDFLGSLTNWKSVLPTDHLPTSIYSIFGNMAIIFEAYNHDIFKQDELMLRANLDVHDIWQSGEVDMWVPLSDAKSGRIHVRASWLDLDQAADSLEPQLEEIRALQTSTKNPLHSAVLLVWIDSARKLNPSHKNIPDPLVRLHVGNSQQETTERQRTNDPVFEEGFSFLVRNPRTQELKVEVVDKKTSTLQGKIELDLKVLLKERNLEIMNEEYPLSGASGGLASLKMNLSLRILKTVQKRDDGDGGPKEIGEANQLPPSAPPSTTEQPTTTTTTTTSTPPPSPTTTTTTTTTNPPQPQPTPAPSAEIPDSRPAPVKASDEVAGEGDEASVGGEDPTDGAKEEVVTVATSLPNQATPTEAAEEDTAVRQRLPERGAHGLGRIELTVKYGPRNNLMIVVHRVLNLPAEEDGELPDPYVKLYLLPDRSRDSKRKTDVIKDSCNPQYDERFEYALPPNELTKRTLEVTVINKKGLMFLQRSPKMGQVLLDCGLLDASKVTQLYDLCPATDDEDE